MTDDNQSSFALGLTPADVEEFCVILREECGEELDPQEAWSRAIQVLALFHFFLTRAESGPQERKLELSAGP